VEDVKPALIEQHNHFTKELIPLFPDNKEGRILEIGAGYGPFLYSLKKSGYHSIQGVDLSEEQVQVAEKLGLPVRLGDLNDALRDEEYDVIVGIDILEHLTRDELSEVLPKIQKALKPGGVGIFRMPNMDAPMASVYAFADVSHETFFNKSSAQQMFTAAGFAQTEVFPSLIRNQSAWKEAIRKVLWWKFKLVIKLLLFATGRTWNDVVFTPNLIVRVKR
jgi:2-polyprenyl-3-methyl-5-hydroxy-6-metoxy-1,4-benzoquinol methylase